MALPGPVEAVMDAAKVATSVEWQKLNEVVEMAVRGLDKENMDSFKELYAQLQSAASNRSKMMTAVLSLAVASGAIGGKGDEE